MGSGTATDYLMDQEEATNGPEHRAALVRSSELVRAERRNRILALRRNGFTYDEISTALAKGEDGKEPFQISPSSAASAVTRYVEQLAEADSEAADTVRQMDNERLERMFRRLEIDARLQGTTAEDKKLRERAIRTQLAVLDRHAKLNGLDAPQRIESKLDVNVHGVAGGDHVAQVESEFAERLGKTIDLPASACKELPSGDED